MKNKSKRMQCMYQIAKSALSSETKPLEMHHRSSKAFNRKINQENNEKSRKFMAMSIKLSLSRPFTHIAVRLTM